MKIETYKSLGVKRGDRILIYMPMIAEATFAILASARIGAIHSVVFGGFAPAELAAREAEEMVAGALEKAGLKAEVADAVWDETRSGHVAAGSFGEGVLVQDVNAGGIAAGAFATGAITAGAIAADAIGASELAADAVAEIQSGLSTLTQANIRTAVGLASANLDTQLADLPTVAEFEARTLVAELLRPSRRYRHCRHEQR